MCFGLGSWYEKKFSIKDDPIADVGKERIGICVGIGVSRDGTRPSPMSLEVATKAALMYGQSIDHIILVSTNGENSFSEVQAMEDVLVWHHIPIEDMRFDQTPYGEANTRVNAVEAKRIMDENNWRDFIIIAQQWHAGRVKRVFSKVFGQEVVVVKAWSEYGDAHQTRLCNLWLFHLWEWIATKIFRLKGWI